MMLESTQKTSQQNKALLTGTYTSFQINKRFIFHTQHFIQDGLNSDKLVRINYTFWSESNGSINQGLSHPKFCTHAYSTFRMVSKASNLYANTPSISLYCHVHKKVSEYDQKMPQPHCRPAHGRMRKTLNVVKILTLI